MVTTTKNTLKIVQDSNGESPREWDNLGTIAYKSRNYTLGEEKIDDPIEWLEDMLDRPRKYEYTNERLEELETIFFEKYIALPVYKYEHSGIAISTTPFSCSWDSGKIGYIYISKEDTRKEYSVKRITNKIKEKVLSVLKGEIEIFNTYINNDIYGFQILNEDEDIIDSCYGFYGTDWKNNGIMEHIDNELLDVTEKELEVILSEIEIEY